MGSDAVDEKPKRVSELVEPASLLIEEAADFASEGKTDEAIEKYRKALEELDRIEMENPDRVKSVEFATVRNKRAYVNAAIDSMLLSQVQSNAKAVSVSDTTELERRLDRERWGKRVDKAKEAFDRRNTEAALAEIEKARKGTTNAVMIAVAYDVEAGICCQKGAFGNARRALMQSRQLLSRARTLAEADSQMVRDILQAVRSTIVDGYEKALAAGNRVSEGSAKLETMDLTSSNAVAAVGEVVTSLDALQGHLSVFAFPAARNLSGTASNLQVRTSLLLRRLEAGSENLKWTEDISEFEASLEAFDAFSPDVDAVDASIASALKMVKKDEEENKGEEVKGEENKGEEVKAEEQVDAKPVPAPKTPEEVSKPAAPVVPVVPVNPKTKREQAMVAIAKGDFATAERIIGELLVEKPNGAVPLNLKAVLEARQGKFKEAEKTLDQAIMSNPRNHFAYYNMANLMLQVRPDDKSAAKRYYETGRVFGGPVDARLEEALK